MYHQIAMDATTRYSESTAAGARGSGGNNRYQYNRPTSGGSSPFDERVVDYDWPEWLMNDVDPFVGGCFDASSPVGFAGFGSGPPLPLLGELGPREEVNALIDHQHYCRKAPEDILTLEFMDSVSQWTESSCREGAMNGAYSMPLNEPDLEMAGPPKIDQAHMDWLETFGPINNCDGLPSDLDAAANNVDWEQWTKYLENEEKSMMDSYPGTPGMDNTMGYDIFANTPSPFSQYQHQPTYSVDAVVKEEDAQRPNTSNWQPMPFMIKQEAPSTPINYDYYPHCDDVKPPVTKCHSATSLFNKNYHISSTSLLNKRVVAGVPEMKVSRRGRPKKIRLPENKKAMTVAERRKAMNRDAALRYRERKKAELDDLHQAEMVLWTENARLRAQEEQLERDLLEIKQQLRAVGCPVF